MIKHKLATIILSGSLAVTGTGFAVASVAKLNIEKNLVTTNRKVSTYVNGVNNTLNESKKYIKSEENENNKLTLRNKTLETINKDNEKKLTQKEDKNEVLMRKIRSLENTNWRLHHENRELSNKVRKDNGKINSLLKTLSIMQGSSNFRNMTKTQQEEVIATLLNYWGYGSEMAQSIAGMLSWGSGMNGDLVAKIGYNATKSKEKATLKNDGQVDSNKTKESNLKDNGYSSTLNKNVNTNININSTK